MTREQLDAGWKLVGEIEETEAIRKRVSNNSLFFAAGLGDTELLKIDGAVKKPVLDLLDARLEKLRAQFAAL